MLVPLISRAVQALFAAVVLGLSIIAVRWQVYGTAPAQSGCASFAGAFGILAAAIGIAGIWITALSTLILAAIDGLAGVLLLIGGIIYALALRNLDCGTTATVREGDKWKWTPAVTSHPLLTGGRGKETDEGLPLGLSEGRDYGQQNSEFTARCHKAKANMVFMFLAFLSCLTTAALIWLHRRRLGGKRSGRV